MFRAGVPIEAYIVHVPPEHHQPLTALPSIKEEILGHLSGSEEEEFAEEFFETEERILSSKMFEGSVHTECALLGLLAHGGLATNSPALHALFHYEGKPLPSLPELFQVRSHSTCKA